MGRLVSKNISRSPVDSSILALVMVSSVARGRQLLVTLGCLLLAVGGHRGPRPRSRVVPPETTQAEGVTRA